jgi:hypothetical protein
MIALLAPLTLEISLAPIWTVLLARGRIGWIATADAALAVGNIAVSLVLAVAFGMGLMGFALGNTIALLAKNLILRPLIVRKEPGLPSMGTVFVYLGRAIAGSAPGLLLLWAARRFIGGSLASVLIASLAAGVLCLAGSLALTIGYKGLRELARTARAGRRLRSNDAKP